MNTYWRSMWNPKLRRVMVLLSKQGRQYRERVSQIIFVQTHGKVHFTGPVAVDAIAYPPDRRERDLDNLPKSVFDALQKTAILERDSQICDMRFRRGHVVTGGALILRIIPHVPTTTEAFNYESNSRGIYEST